MRVDFSAAAKEDLMDIAVHIAQNNPERAFSFVDELEAKCLAVGQTPDIGTTQPKLGNNVRMLPHGRYLIFYRQGENSIRIERVMHGARDIGGDDFDAEG
jgi:toxin ParE1/3/4